MVRFRTKRAATIVCDKSPKLAHDRLLWQVYINPDLSLEERQRNFLKRQNKRNMATEAAMGAGGATTSTPVLPGNPSGGANPAMIESSQQQ